ncbi:Swt1 family HEPN domain-containing protein [Actinocorallia longicatena]|uniref:Swt1 family HEPN domain-containing protein n=1 Tax=Actinocorallia longicatena TaxID=111803 RepID=UPI0031CF5BCF
MVAKLINHDQVTGGLRLVTGVLNPVVQEHMTRAHGGRWQARFAQRHPRTGMTQESLGDLGYLVWVLTKEETAFRGKLPGRVFQLAHRVREARNLASHDQLNDLDPAAATTALQNMAEFVTLLGSPGTGNEIRQLAGRVKGAAPNTPHVVKPVTAPSRKKGKGRRAAPAPRRAAPVPARPVVQVKIGCGAVAALALIGITVAWVVFGPEEPDPYQGRFKDEKVGARLNGGQVEMSDGYHLELLDEPLKPAEGLYDGQLAFTGGEISAPDGRIVVLTRKEKLGYATCQAATRYVTSAKAAKGLRLCLTTDKGVVAGVAVKSVSRQDAHVFVKLDLAVWKGRK